MLRNKIQGLEATDPEFPQLSLAERRSKLRIRTYIRLEIKVSDAVASAIVTDLSLDGMRLRTNYALELGDRVEVRFLSDADAEVPAPVFCRVVWVTDFGTPGHVTYEVGLSFEQVEVEEQNTWVRYILEQLGFDERKTFQKRRFLRASGRVPARVYRLHHEESVAGEIVNIGVGGALLSCEERLPTDMLIHCEICLWRILPALRLPCRILSVHEEDEGENTRYLHSLLFLAVDTEQVKLLGNYVIFLINQCED